MRFAMLVGGVLLGALFLPADARAVQCDGTELLCLELTSQAEVTGAGGTVAGGDFNATGFQPSNNGGVDWSFGPGTDFSWGRIELDVTGLLPVDAAELAGGKVSLFSFCGEPPQDLEYIGFQKMPPDYRDGHIFRYGMDDDGLADNWDAVIITGAGFNCYYSINDPPWQSTETHHIIAEWDGAGLSVDIDGWQCSKPGNGDTFDPLDKLFVLGNRCEHYPNQHPVARLSNLRLWALSHHPGCDTGPLMEAVSLAPTTGRGTGTTFVAVYSHCLGVDALRVVELLVADAPDEASSPALHVQYEGGLLRLEGQTCAPGEAATLTGTHGSLDCAQSGFNNTGEQAAVYWALGFDAQTFAGQHELYLGARGGPGNPEPRLEWTSLGTYVVEAEEPDAGVTPVDAAPLVDAADVVDAAPEDGPGSASGGCDCAAAPGDGMVLPALLLLALWLRRRRSR